MATFEEFRLLLVLYFDANLISDEHCLLLYEMVPSKTPYNEKNGFHLDITHE